MKIDFPASTVRSPELRQLPREGAASPRRRALSSCSLFCVVFALLFALALLPAQALAGDCNDGIDNDGDGRKDFPADLGCLGADDVSEISDRDQDGITDLADLCIEAADPSQLDTDGDGYGNACDPDYDQNGFVTTLDFPIFLDAFIGVTPGDGVTDHNGDGQTTTLDFRVFLEHFISGSLGPAGPFQIAPVVSALEMDQTVFPVPVDGARFPVHFRFSYEDTDADLLQVVIGLDGPSGPVFQFFDDFSTPDSAGLAERLLAIDSSFGPGDYTLSVQLIDAAENLSNVESVVFSLDAGVAPPIQIFSFSPSNAAPGDAVQILGAGFTSVSPDELRVSFPGAERSAEITSVASGELNVIVPPGAVSGPILLETPLGMTPSASAITVTPTVSLTPSTHELLPGESVPLVCRVSGIEAALVDWTAGAGVVDDVGVYTAPAEIPPVNPVAVRCAWQGDPGLYAETLVTILPPTPMPGQTMVLASEGGEVFTAALEVEVAIAPLALPGDTNLAIQLPPRSVFPPDTTTSVIPASVELTPAGITFAQPATATFQLRHWMAPGTTLQTYRAGVPITMATVDSSGLAAVAELPSTGLYNLQADLAVGTDSAGGILAGLVAQAQEFEITRPAGTELLEGLRIPILIQSTTPPPNEVGPFFEGVEVEASLDGHGPIAVGPRVQPDATAWELGTFLDIPVMTDCGAGQTRDGVVYVRYPAASGTTAELALDFTIDCLDELEFALGQPPVPMPPASFWDEYEGRGRLRLIPTPGTPTHRFSRVVVGDGGELAPYQGPPFAGPLTVEVTRDLRVETGGRISTETFEPPFDPRAVPPIDGGTWNASGVFGTGIEPGEGGEGSYWYGAMGGDGGGGTSENGSDGDASINGGVGGEGGVLWEYADWVSAVAAGATTVVSLATQNWGFAAEGVLDLQTQVVRISEVEANRIRGTGRGGRAPMTRQLGLSDAPRGGGGGGGSGKMIYDCSFFGLDFCSDKGGQGGGGGGGGAHPLEVLVGGSVFVEPGASIQGRGGPGGWGGIKIDNAPGGGGGGGNGAYIRIAAMTLFNQGNLTVEGGQPGLSIGCVCPGGVSCTWVERACFGDNFVIRVGNGEKGRDGIFRIEGWLNGQRPPATQLSYTSTPSDPWNQIYTFPFSGLGDGDGDGLKDGLESWIGTDPGRADSDLDGLGDYEELFDYGTDPTLRDTDGDGLSDGDELAANPWVTDPLLRDTDGDGIDDDLEIDRGSDPTNENSTPEICDGVDNDLDTAIDEDCEVRLDHQGREFFIPFLLNEGIGTTTLSLIVTSEGFADVTVEYPVGTTIGTWSVTPDDEAIISIPNGAANAWPLWSYPTAPPTPPLSGAVASNAVRVTATFDVAVVARNSEPGTQDKALALPTELLGSEYYVLAERPSGTPTFGPGAHFVVVATEDATTVTVDGITTGLAPVVLDRGEGVAIQSWYGVVGTHVVADKKVAVANGNRCTQFPAGGGRYCSHLYEIALPVERWENEYLASTTGNFSGLTYGGRDVLSQETYLVAAAQDDTSLTVNGTYVGMLNAGETWELGPFSGTADFAHIEADKPIFGVQFMNSLCYEFPGDPGCTNVGNSLAVGSASMANLIPLGRFPRLTRFQGAEVYTVVVPTADAASGGVLVDGVAINPSAFEPFPSVPSWSVFSGTLGFPSALHTLESPAGHGAWLINAGFGTGSTAPLGYDYDVPHGQQTCSGSVSLRRRQPRLPLRRGRGLRNRGALHAPVLSVDDQPGGVLALVEYGRARVRGARLGRQRRGEAARGQPHHALRAHGDDHGRLGARLAPVDHDPERGLLHRLDPDERRALLQRGRR